MSSDETTNFQKEYNLLKSIAEDMQSKDIDDVDELLSKVEQGVKSYKICQARLDKAKKQLDTLLKGTESESSPDVKISS
ncbi:MAG: exodeoxyribonuclease VII small subunit [Gammaproteobacteria bacterium]|nr:exodeoxyribonuclease VII small subunit [Gammaproteobacteria bacterium]